MKRTECSRCGTTLEPTLFGPDEWRACPVHEPEMFPRLIPEGYALVPTISEHTREHSRRLSHRLTETE